MRDREKKTSGAVLTRTAQISPPGGLGPGPLGARRRAPTIRATEADEVWGRWAGDRTAANPSMVDERGMGKGWAGHG